MAVPALDEAGRLPLLLADLAKAPAIDAELVVSDGGSSDGTPLLARLAVRRCCTAPPGEDSN